VAFDAAGNAVSFYAATAGEEAAFLVTLGLGSSLPSTSGENLAQLTPLQESSLAFVGTLLVVMIEPSASEPALEPAETQAVTTSLFVAAPVGQGLLAPLGPNGEVEALGPENPAAPVAVPIPQGAPAWEHFVLGLDEAFEQAHQEARDRPLGAGGPKPGGGGGIREEAPLFDDAMGLWSPTEREPGDVLAHEQPVDPAPASPPEFTGIDRIGPAPEVPARPIAPAPRFPERADSWLIPVSISWIALTRVSTSDASSRTGRCDRPEHED
jgi:hypothetical protein